MIVVIVGSPFSGKTEVLKKFSEKGISIFHTDSFITKIYKKNEIGYKKIKEKFGNEFVNSVSVDKDRIKNEIISNSNFLNELNFLIHPLIKKYLEDKNNFVAELPIITTSPIKFNYDKIILVKADLKEISKRYSKKYSNLNEIFLREMIKKWDNNIEFDFVIDTTNGIDDNIIDALINQLFK